MCDGASLLVYGEPGEAQCGEQAESRIGERLYGLLDFDSRGVEYVLLSSISMTSSATIEVRYSHNSLRHAMSRAGHNAEQLRT